LEEASHAAGRIGNLGTHKKNQVFRPVGENQASADHCPGRKKVLAYPEKGKSFRGKGETYDLSQAGIGGAKVLREGRIPPKKPNPKGL